MDTVHAIVTADADGQVRVPLPPEWRGATVKVVATITRAADDPDEVRRRKADALAALRELRAAGGIRGIADPVAWQRDLRRDRPLPGRAP